MWGQKSPGLAQMFEAAQCLSTEHAKCCRMSASVCNWNKFRKDTQTDIRNHEPLRYLEVISSCAVCYFALTHKLSRYFHCRALSVFNTAQTLKWFYRSEHSYSPQQTVNWLFSHFVHTAPHTGWTDPIWTQWKKEIPLSGIEPWPLASSSVTGFGCLSNRKESQTSADSLVYITLNQILPYLNYRVPIGHLTHGLRNEIWTVPCLKDGGFYRYSVVKKNKRA
jgi:hypothetical protein